MTPRIRAHVDHIIGMEHHLLVVFHHNHRIAGIAEFFKGVDEPEIIAVVQADARLIENIEDVDQLGSDLGGQPDAL